jgi:tRNA pseudouridine38-40 synthase
MSSADVPALPVPVIGEGGFVRLRGQVAYDGTEFSGWARQRDRRTVQQCVEEAFATVLRFAPSLTVAGRTDAGVHALGQVIHLDLPGSVLTEFGFDPVDPAPFLDRLTRKVDGVLPVDVRLRALIVAPHGFDARFAALWREYVYRICDDRSAADPLRRGDTVNWPKPLDAAAMAWAGALMVGMHDFAAFCRRREGATTIRELQRVEVERVNGVIECVVRADAFCHSMVRSLVGALLAVGEGRKHTSWPAELLRIEGRANGVTVAPAHGLTLMHVQYPPDHELAGRTQVTRNVRA